jgi:hypothetical protein
MDNIDVESSKISRVIPVPQIRIQLVSLVTNNLFPAAQCAREAELASLSWNLLQHAC